MTRELVENCFVLTPTIVFNNLERLRKIGSPIDERRSDIHYWTEEDGEDLCLFITVNGNGPQKVVLEEFFSPIIDRHYFRCECGHRVFKLYLPPHQTAFKCRECYKLQYILTTFNSGTGHGRARYQFIRMDKLSQERVNIGTAIYKGQYTKRFKRFLRMCERAGLIDIVCAAQGLMDGLQAFQRQQQEFRQSPKI